MKLGLLFDPPITIELKLPAVRLVGMLFFCLFFNIQCAKAIVQITNLNDLNLGSWDGSSGLTAQDDVCIYNDASPNYLITASGTGAGGALQLQSGLNSLTYTLDFKDMTGSFTNVPANTPTSFTDANEVSATCSGGTNATFRVNISNSALMSVSKGSYSGTLSLQLDPN